jgi:pimeloyl-ACP methyl ester carboxylesterase
MSEINSFTFGEGEISVVLVHGWAASGRMWENIYPHFTNASFSALEFGGFGKSPCPEIPPTIEHHVTSLIEFCEAKKPQMIIAHSMGGLITLKSIIQRPDLAQQLLLICPVVTGKFGLNGILSNLIRNPMGAAALRASELIWPALQKEYLIKLATDPWHTNPYLARRVQQDFVELNHRAALEALVSMSQQNTEAQLSQISQPTLVCVGAGDLTVPPSEGKIAASLIPNAELVVFDKARHHPMDEQTDDFVPVLKDFLGRYGIH